VQYRSAGLESIACGLLFRTLLVAGHFNVWTLRRLNNWGLHVLESAQFGRPTGMLWQTVDTLRCYPLALLYNGHATLQASKHQLHIVTCCPESC
jgi:hypothetical protein